MKTLIYACCLALIYFSCQKEFSYESNDDVTITGKQWRLSGNKSDTSKYWDWNPLRYEPYYYYSDYYCIPTPMIAHFLEEIILVLINVQ